MRNEGRFILGIPTDKRRFMLCEECCVRNEGRLRTGALLRGGRREQLGGELFEELEVHAV